MEETSSGRTGEDLFGFRGDGSVTCWGRGGVAGVLRSGIGPGFESETVGAAVFQMARCCSKEASRSVMGRSSSETTRSWLEDLGRLRGASHIRAQRLDCMKGGSLGAGGGGAR